jgi:Flp pilus assembly protein TadD
MTRSAPGRHAVVLLLACTSCTAPPGLNDRGSGLKLAGIELAGGAPDAALQSAQEVLQASPHDATAWVLAGDAQAQLGQAERAQASYTRALAEDGASVPAALGLAKLQLAQDPAAAAAALRPLAAAHPHDARIWTDLGVAYDLQSRPADAQRAYRRAMQEAPLLPTPQADLGLSLALAGHPVEGAALLRPLATAPQATARLRADYALAATLAGQRQAAQAMLGQDLPPEQVASALSRYNDLRNAPP